MKHWLKKYGNVALVTGASSGIGEEFARQLARAGMDLVLVARRKDTLDALAAELERTHDVRVRIIALDLLQEGAVELLVSETNDVEIGLAVLDAGMEVHGAFVENALEKETAVLTLNALIPMQLAHMFGEKMAKRKRGGIIFVSSTFGHQAVPYFANYAASKAYILSLGQALHYELKRLSVDVLVLSPGLTKTAMAENMRDVDFTKMPIVAMEVGPVVTTALQALGKQPVVIPGARNKFLDAMGKYTASRAMLTDMFGRMVSRAMNIS